MRWKRVKMSTLYTRKQWNSGPDEGAPGLRGETFYGAYFRDLDGKKRAVFCKDFLGA